MSILPGAAFGRWSSDGVYEILENPPESVVLDVALAAAGIADGGALVIAGGAACVSVAIGLLLGDWAEFCGGRKTGAAGADENAAGAAPADENAVGAVAAGAAGAAAD